MLSTHWLVKKGERDKTIALFDQLLCFCVFSCSKAWKRKKCLEEEGRRRRSIATEKGFKAFVREEKKNHFKEQNTVRIRPAILLPSVFLLFFFALGFCSVVRGAEEKVRYEFVEWFCSRADEDEDKEEEEEDNKKNQQQKKTAELFSF